MKQYSKYKFSGIQWLGDIPDHWQVKRVKDGLTLITVSSISDVKIGLENIESGTGKFIKTDTEFDGNGVAFTKNDIIYGKLRPYLQKVWIAEFEGNAVGDFFVFRAKNDVNFYFIKWWMLSDIFTKKADGSTFGAKMPRVSSDFILNLQIPLPPLAEQTSIAAYLDSKTANIDRRISLLREKIEHYKQLRRALISNVVTRGVDKNVELKNSGIQWLGDIPKHWMVKRVKDVVKLQSGDNITSEDIDEVGLYPVYGGNGLRGYYDKYNVDGFFALIGRQGALCGNINYGKGKFWATDHAVVCYQDKNTDVKWFGELLKAMNLNQYSNASAQPGLAVERIKILLIPVPPLAEQTAIAAYLDEKTAQIDAIVDKCEMQIEKLSELRRSLIAQAVTGQIKVC